MRGTLTRVAAALRAFARGFLGLGVAPPPREPRELHRHLEERARNRPTCC